METVAARCTEVESGARNVDNILTNTLLPEISVRLLEQLAAGGMIASINVGVTADGAFSYRVESPAPVEEPSVVPASSATLPSARSGGEAMPVA